MMVRNVRYGMQLEVIKYGKNHYHHLREIFARDLSFNSFIILTAVNTATQSSKIYFSY